MFLNEHHCSRIHTAPGESREEVCVPPATLFWSPPTHPPLPRVLDVLHLPLITWSSHVVWALWGQRIVSWVTCLLHHLLFKTCMWHRKEWGQDTGLDGTQNVSTGLSLLTPSSLFFFFFNFYLSKEANRPNFKPKLLVRVPKVSHHHIHDWNLINLGSIDLHHSLSIALPRLQHETQRKELIREAEINRFFLLF